MFGKRKELFKKGGSDETRRGTIGHGQEVHLEFVVKVPRQKTLVAGRWYDRTETRVQFLSRCRREEEYREDYEDS